MPRRFRPELPKMPVEPLRDALMPQLQDEQAGPVHAWAYRRPHFLRGECQLALLHRFRHVLRHQFALLWHTQVGRKLMQRE